MRRTYLKRGKHTLVDCLFGLSQARIHVQPGRMVAAQLRLWHYRKSLPLPSFPFTDVLKRGHGFQADCWKLVMADWRLTPGMREVTCG